MRAYVETKQHETTETFWALLVSIEDDIQTKCYYILGFKQGASARKIDETGLTQVPKA